MSTYWYFECVGHDPGIQGEEFTQHTDDEYFRAAVDLANSRPVEQKQLTFDDGVRDYFDSNARDFLLQHPRCPLELVNEYGERRPLTVSAPIEGDAP